MDFSNKMGVRGTVSMMVIVQVKILVYIYNMTFVWKPVAYESGFLCQPERDSATWRVKWRNYALNSRAPGQSCEPISPRYRQHLDPASTHTPSLYPWDPAPPLLPPSFPCFLALKYIVLLCPGTSHHKKSYWKAAPASTVLPLPVQSPAVLSTRLALFLIHNVPSHFPPCARNAISLLTAWLPYTHQLQEAWTWFPTLRHTGL